MPARELTYSAVRVHRLGCQINNGVPTAIRNRSQSVEIITIGLYPCGARRRWL